MDNVEKLFEILQLIYEDSQLYKGIFWIKDINNISDSKLYFQIPCNSNGDVISNNDNIEFSSKSGKSFNHENTWKSLTKNDTDNKPFNYYPRGRVEINNNKAIIYCNQNIANNELKRWCIDKFNLNNHNGIKDVILKIDNSNHYKCYLD